MSEQDTFDSIEEARDIADVPAVEVINTVAVHLLSAAAVKLGLADDPENQLDLDEARERAVLLVEWGARFGDALATDRLEIVLARPIEGPRAARITAHGPRAHTLLSDLVTALAVPAVP